MKKAIIFCVISIISGVSSISGQDIHFSQFNNTPLIINPALTGMFNGNHRVFLNYKDQWRSIGAPYKTYAISYDMVLFKEKWEKSYLGGGFYVFNDKAGDSEFSTTQFNLSLSGIVPLNDHHKLSAGLQGGFAQKSVDYTNVTTDNQYFNGQYNSGSDKGESNNLNSAGFGDFTAGIAWGYIKNEKHITANNQFKANAGIAVFHINKPKQEFYSFVTEKLYAKFVIHGSTYIGLKNTNITLLPSVLFIKQGPSIETNFGGMVRYRMKEGSKYTGFIKESVISFGSYFRPGDALIPAFMLEIANFAVGISYDINVSGLKVATSGRGGIEISLRYLNPNPFKRDKAKTLY